MTILFLDDWKRFPGAIVDETTTNRSFIELADKYHQMGLKNYFFHLTLLNPMLKGVDPFSDNLTQEQMVMIQLEARYNPWYFFREIFRLPSQGTPLPDILQANRGNIGAFWLYYNHIDFGLTQPRQTGKSVGADGLNTQVSQVAGRRSTWTLITKDHELRTKNIQRLKDMRDLLPPYLNPYNKREDTNNPFGISVVAHENKVSTGVAQSSESAALNLGRGNSSENNQVDEGPFCKNVHITIPAFLASATAARDNAAKAGSFYCNLFTTTSGKLDTVEGKYMYDLFMGGTQFNELMLFDLKNQEQLTRVVEKQSKGTKPLVYINLSHRQLGKTDEWLYQKISESNAKGDEAERDYMCRWTTGSLSNPLSQAVLNAIRESKRNPTHVTVTDRMYCINWFIPEESIQSYMSSGVKLILGNDMSTGVGKDNITMYLVNSLTAETVFTVSVSETNIYSFTEWFVDLMVKYENIIVIPEAKSVGITLIDTMIVRLIALNINPFRRIYNTVIEDNLHMSDPEYRFIHSEPITWPSYIADKHKKRFGYGTAAGGRHRRDNLYVETLTRAADICANVIFDDGLCTEIGHLVVKNGRIDHAASGHDDMVIAWLLTMWFLIHSKNLDQYGIQNPLSLARPLTRQIEENKTPTPWAKLERDRNNETIERIKLLAVLMSDEDNQVLVDAYESQIRMLSRRVVTSTSDSQTIDQLIKQAREERDKKLQDRRNNAWQ